MSKYNTFFGIAPAAKVAAALVIVAVVACSPSGDETPEDAASAAVVHAPEAGETFFRNVRQLTFGGQNAEAYWSPDGKQLIFQRTTSDSTCDQQYIINADGTGLRMVSNGLGRTTCGYFYDNGSRVVYASTFQASEACPPQPDMSRGYVWALYDYDIYTSDTNGNDLQKIFGTPGYDGEATLSPDGSRIVFTSTRDGDLDIYTMNVDGSDVRKLTSTLGYDGGPFYSHDGSMIVYRAGRPQTPEEQADYRALLAANMVRPSDMEIWVMNADGSEQHQITNLGGANFAPFFHPDDKRILFSSNHENPQGRNFDLYLINLDGTGLTKVTTHDDFDGFPMFSPDGTQLVFASNRHGSVPAETNIFVADWVEP